jgi:hypothetical protein
MSTLSVNTVKSLNINAPVFQNSTGTEKGQLCKAWCHFTVSSGTPSRDDNFNISGITDHGTGDFTFVFETNMGNTNYAAVSTSEVSSSNINIPQLVASGQLTTGVRFSYFRITTFGGGGQNVDPPAGAIAVFGD